jgi:hypothetical protein
MIYDFDSKNAEGEYYARILDRHFEIHGWKVRKASSQEDLQGVDRFFSQQGEGEYGVQYKADSAAARWGNAFIETESTDVIGKEPRLSGMLKCNAYMLAYFIPPMRTVGLMHLDDFRRNHIDTISNFDWSKWIPSGRDGRRWWVRGRKVPLEVFLKEICFDVQTIDVEFEAFENVRDMAAKTVGSFR